MKSFLKNIGVVIIIVFSILTLINPKFIIDNILEYTNIFIKNFFPVAFIFYLTSSMIVDFKVLEKIENKLNINTSVIYIIIISIITGSPSGANFIKEFLNTKKIDSKVANYLIFFTHFPNPLFVLGTVGIIIKSRRITYLIFLSIVISNLIIGLILMRNNKTKCILKNKDLDSLSFSENLSKNIYKSFKLIILIYGISLFFNSISSLIIYYFNFKYPINILINGFFDLTKGVSQTSIIKDIRVRSLLIITFISFGSISIHMQVKSIISKTNISYLNFLLGRIYQIIISDCLFLLLYKLFIV